MESQRKYHFFWRKGSPFSQWHPSTYTLNGYVYTTAEQGMMHGKALLFGDDEIGNLILQTNNDPRSVKALGRQVRGFNEKLWKQYREEIVYNNNVAKFSQNEHLLNALLSTEGLLVEASPCDAIWGIGLHEKDARKMPEHKWRGINLLGKILTRVRDELKLVDQETLLLQTRQTEQGRNQEEVQVLQEQSASEEGEETTNAASGSTATSGDIKTTGRRMERKQKRKEKKSRGGKGGRKHERQMW